MFIIFIFLSINLKTSTDNLTHFNLKYKIYDSSNLFFFSKIYILINYINIEEYKKKQFKEILNIHNISFDIIHSLNNLQKIGYFMYSYFFF
jgi:hypothetical protein